MTGSAVPAGPAVPELTIAGQNQPRQRPGQHAEGKARQGPPPPTGRYHPRGRGDIAGLDRGWARLEFSVTGT